MGFESLRARAGQRLDSHISRACPDIFVTRMRARSTQERPLGWCRRGRGSYSPRPPVRQRGPLPGRWCRAGRWSLQRGDRGADAAVVGVLGNAADRSGARPMADGSVMSHRSRYAATSLAVARHRAGSAAGSGGPRIQGALPVRSGPGRRRRGPRSVRTAVAARSAAAGRSGPRWPRAAARRSTGAAPAGRRPWPPRCARGSRRLPQG